MPSKATILKTIDAVYKARNANDQAGVRKFWAPGAKFTLVSKAPILGASIRGGKAGKATDALMEAFIFTRQKRLDAVVEGNTAAVRWAISFKAPKGKGTTELFDLWTFDKDGKVKSIVQFGDTALMMSMV